ncbi:MAG: PKD domain-containing protein [Schleiferiaceae bacterium]|nr:PKD domain-containing protein [Schleiferiaceae bacterium]
MKKLLLALLIGISAQLTAQQVGAFNIHVVDQNGNPMPNVPVFLEGGSNSGAISTLTSLTDNNGQVLDSLGIGNTGYLMAIAGTALCADTAYMTFTPNNGPWVWLVDTLVLCGSSGTNCNFAYGASSTAIAPMTFNFWQQSNGSNILWDFGDGNTSTSPNPVHTYSAPGTYIYCLQVDSCPTVCDTLVVMGNPSTCQALFAIDTNSIAPGNVNIFNLSTPANMLGVQYLWDFGDGNTSTLPYPSHTYANSGTYVLCLAINVPASPATPACSDLYCDTLKIDSLGNLVLKTAASFTINILDPNATVSINEDQISEFNLFPNPAGDFTRLEFNAFKANKAKFTLTNLNGQILKTESLEFKPGSNRIEINMSNLNEGLYLLHFETEGFTKTAKLIKL